MLLKHEIMQANDKRLYYKEDGTCIEDSYFSCNLKEVYYQTWGYASHKHDKWLYKDERGELNQVKDENLPGPIKLAIMLMEDL